MRRGRADAFARAEARPRGWSLVDLGLPRREGWTSLVRLRAAADPPPVIVVVARADYRGFAQAIREGAAAYVFRPFVTADLLALCEASSRAAAPARRRGAPARRRSSRRR
jgi:DNA-binding response OmpR family regulator